jgi:recombination protein RecA
MVAAPVLPLRTGLSGLPSQPLREAPRPLPRGRLIELAAGPDAAATTLAVQILLESQREGDPVVWVQPRGGALHPPDLAAAGLDLDALLVVHVPADRGPAALPKAAELALRTGAFGALVLDVADARVPRGAAWLGRLASLSREHDCRCVLLGPAGEASLGPLVSLRLRARRRRVRPGRHRLEVEVLKDKAGLRPALPGPRVWVGPEGMP